MFYSNEKIDSCTNFSIDMVDEHKEYDSENMSITGNCGQPPAYWE